MLKSIDSIGKLFERLRKILTSNKIDPDFFEIQFAAFRNYNSSIDDIFVVSSWENKPEKLASFMKKINKVGGNGNKAIEIGLWHANCENKKQTVSQVILIGDSPANTKEEVKQIRSESQKVMFWEKTKFSNPTYYKDELDQLIQKNIPVHAFYVGQNANDNFKEISSKSNGRYESLDLESTKGTEMLTSFLAEEILRKISDNAGLEDELVKQYQAQFGSI